MGLGCALTIDEDLVESCPAFGVSGGNNEALEEGSIDTVVLHPPKVKVCSGGADRAEDLGDRSVGMIESGGKTVFYREFTNVGPDVDGAMSGFKGAAFGVVLPSVSGAIGGSPEPSLISTHDLALEPFGMERLQGGGDQQEDTEERGKADHDQGRLGAGEYFSMRSGLGR